MNENKVMRALHRLGEIAISVVSAVIGVVSAVFGLDKRHPSSRDNQKELEDDPFLKTIPEDKRDEAGVLQTLHPDCKIAYLSKTKGLGLSRDERDNGGVFAVHDTENNNTAFIYISNDRQTVRELGGDKLCRIPAEFRNNDDITVASLTHTLLNTRDKSAPGYDTNIDCASRLLRNYVCNKTGIRKEDIDACFSGQSLDQTMRFSKALQEEAKNGTIHPDLLPYIIKTGLAADALCVPTGARMKTVNVGPLHIDFEKDGADNGRDCVRVHNAISGEQHTYAMEGVDRETLKRLIDDALISAYATGTIARGLKHFEKDLTDGVPHAEQEDMDMHDAIAAHTEQTIQSAISAFPMDRNSEVSVDVWAVDPHVATLTITHYHGDDHNDCAREVSAFTIDMQNGTVSIDEITANYATEKGALTHTVDPAHASGNGFEEVLIKGLMNHADASFGARAAYPELFQLTPDASVKDEWINDVHVRVERNQQNPEAFDISMHTVDSTIEKLEGLDQDGATSAINRRIIDKNAEYAGCAQVYAREVARSMLSQELGMDVSPNFTAPTVPETQRLVDACQAAPYDVSQYINPHDVLQNMQMERQHVLGFVFDHDGNGGIIATDTFTGATASLGSTDDYDALSQRMYELLSQRANGMEITQFTHAEPEQEPSQGYRIEPIAPLDTAYRDEDIDAFYDGLGLDNEPFDEQEDYEDYEGYADDGPNDPRW